MYWFKNISGIRVSQMGLMLNDSGCRFRGAREPKQEVAMGDKFCNLPALNVDGYLVRPNEGKKSIK